jgi:peptidyl-prolyl cis-trans isomerase B (cyclophilin B)
LASDREKIEAAAKTLDLAKNDYTVELTTNKGPIRLEFYADVAPGHVANFVSLAKAGMYDGLTFHRVIKDFMIQGGCPLGTGTGDRGYKIKAEFNKKPHTAGVLSMARSNDPNSAGSQFFICLGTQSFLDGKYTAFGKTLDQESMDTVSKIGASATDSNDKPKEKVVIQKATVTEKPK